MFQVGYLKKVNLGRLKCEI